MRILPNEEIKTRISHGNKQTVAKNLYKTTKTIQSNTILNKAILSLVGFQLPFCLSANNNTERNERIVQGVWYMSVAFASPFFMLPFINKRVLMKSGIINGLKDKGVEIVRVSKGFLTEDANKMVEGIKETAKILEKDDKLKGISAEYQKILDKFPDKEALRQKLIKAHKDIFMWDFIFTSSLCTAMPWISNLYTRVTTGRKGYSGEFEMAGKDYTDKMSANHEKYKYHKLVASFFLAVLPAFIAPQLIAKSMAKKPQELKGLMKTLNKNAKAFDYTDGKFMSLLTFATMWTLGDFPTYLLATRDKNELQYLAISRSIVGLSYFGGELALSNWMGRALDKTFKTELMHKEKIKNSKGLLKWLTPAKSLDALEKTAAENRTKKFAVGMYWGAMAINAILVGYGIPKTLNIFLEKKVKKKTESKRTMNINSLFTKNKSKVFDNFNSNAT